MSRALRIEYAEAVYHVTSRGNARRSIFKDDQDREMPVIETPSGNLSKGMRQINAVYKTAE
jgi:hypothetical protein